MFDRRLPAFPFNWHYHPEYELTLTLNSVGERFVGDHVARYGDGDLVLVGPNLPHAWQSRSALQPGQPHHAVVAWFTRQWAEGLTLPYPELGGIGQLLAESSRGLFFGPGTAALVRPRLLGLIDAAPAARWLGLVEILLMLAADASREPLALQGFAGEDAPRERARLDRVLAHLHAHYAEPIRLATLAELAAMSESQLQRFFKRCTRTTVSGYLATLRIGHACAMLLEDNRPIAHIAEAAGFTQAAYFTRQFRALKGMTPKEFRAQYSA
ncbi:AraC family transcriptional regulator [Variovorax robiniae]|uniref:AraC family transcriptional regulator n=1 Tax=Variovorax robiniae TaxID=1836199 RepID=A0ABU8X8X0_9BURK